MPALLIPLRRKPARFDKDSRKDPAKHHRCRRLLGYLVCVALLCAPACSRTDDNNSVARSGEIVTGDWNVILIVVDTPCEPIDNKLPESVDTLAEILSDEGYSTGGIISHFILTALAGFGQGFDAYLEGEAKGHRHLSTPGVTDQAIELLDRFEREAQAVLSFRPLLRPAL
jgi:hypothetical protein